MWHWSTCLVIQVKVHALQQVHELVNVTLMTTSILVRWNKKQRHKCVQFKFPDIMQHHQENTAKNQKRVIWWSYLTESSAYPPLCIAQKDVHGPPVVILKGGSNSNVPESVTIQICNTSDAGAKPAHGCHAYVHFAFKLNLLKDPNQRVYWNWKLNVLNINQRTLTSSVSL